MPLALPLSVVNQKSKLVAGGDKIDLCLAKPLGKRLNAYEKQFDHHPRDFSGRLG